MRIWIFSKNYDKYDLFLFFSLEQPEEMSQIHELEEQVETLKTEIQNRFQQNIDKKYGELGNLQSLFQFLIRVRIANFQVHHTFYQYFATIYFVFRFLEFPPAPPIHESVTFPQVALKRKKKEIAFIMAIRVVEFSNRAYKIRKILA